MARTHVFGNRQKKCMTRPVTASPIFEVWLFGLPKCIRPVYLGALLPPGHDGIRTPPASLGDRPVTAAFFARLWTRGLTVVPSSLMFLAEPGGDYSVRSLGRWSP